VILDSIEKSIKEKVQALGTPLSEWDIKINYGIKTGLNEAFIISGRKRREILEKEPKSDEIIRPILRGKDIKRNKINFTDLFLINTHNGIPSMGIKRVDINEYPAIKNHLDTFWGQINRRFDQGDTPYNLRSCAYMEEFTKQKIVFPAIMTQGPFFSLDESGAMILAPGNLITGKNLIGLVSFLTSPVCYYALRSYYMGGGIEGELKVNRLQILPIPIRIDNRKYSFDEVALEFQLNSKEIDNIMESPYINRGFF